MRVLRSLMHAAAGAVLSLAAFAAAAAADYPAPKEGTFIAKDFRFHTGEVLPEVRLHYRTIGEPSGEPVVVLHGTGGSGASMLTPDFAGELFGEGQPLDATKYFIILPDAVGHGKSTKPSDGLKAQFPKYSSEDMVDGQYRLLTEGLGLKHVRLVIGNSMGGMHTWLWGGKYPDYMDALVPMASQPTEMAARNWMMRRLMIETIRQDPGYNNGDYTAQPKAMKLANVSLRANDDETQAPRKFRLEGAGELSRGHAQQSCRDEGRRWRRHRGRPEADGCAGARGGQTRVVCPPPTADAPGGARTGATHGERPRAPT